MLLSQFSAIFANFRRKNWHFFSKTNVMIKFLKKFSFVFSQKRQFLQFFGENILKIVSSVPGRMTSD
jgi:hypothetical protein